MLRLLESIVRKAGHESIACGDGIEALEAIRDQDPDVVILDVMMPRLDGIATLIKLKENPATASVPVIMLTSRGHSFTREQSEEYGASAFLTKPFSPTQILQTIQELITH